VILVAASFAGLPDGTTVVFQLTAPRGDTTGGSGHLDPEGKTAAVLPIFSFGTYTNPKVTARLPDETVVPIDPAPVFPGGSVQVTQQEVPCTKAQVPPAVTTTTVSTTTTTTTTTSRPTTTTVAAQVPPSGPGAVPLTGSRHGFPWWILIVVGVPLVGAGVLLLTRGGPPPPAAPCECGCGVLIEGPGDLAVCECEQVTFSLRTTGSTIAYLDAKKQDGRLLFSRQYRAKVTPTCTGGATPGEPTCEWSMWSDATTVSLSVAAHVAYTCPDGGQGSCTCVVEEFHVALRKAPCLISIITLDVPWNEISHAAIQVTCGEFSVIYGYYSSNTSDLVGSFKGIKGTVKTVRADGPRDEIGEDYSGYYPTYDKRIWLLEVSCDKCDCIRTYWENLANNPGTYTLLTNNCTTQAWKSLESCGIHLTAPNMDGKPQVPYRPGVLEDTMLINENTEKTAEDGTAVKVGEKTTVGKVSKE